MKKFLLAIIAVVAFSVTYAIVPVPEGSGYPSCTITGDPTSSSVNVSSHYVENGVLHVLLANDSKDVNAFVTVTVVFKWKWGDQEETETLRGRVKSTPDFEADCKIPLSTKVKGWLNSRAEITYEVTSIGGNKCN